MMTQWNLKLRLFFVADDAVVQNENTAAGNEVSAAEEEAKKSFLNRWLHADTRDMLRKR